MTIVSTEKAQRERRTKKRYPLNCLVVVSCESEDGTPRTINARTLDWSDNGLRIQCSQRLEVRSFVRVQIRQYGLLGMACVRYCDRKVMDYVAGLEFTGGLSWRNPPPIPHKES